MESTQFQLDCMRSCDEWFAARNSMVRFRMVEGTNESYWRADVVGPTGAGSIYVYEDEAGLMVAPERWFPCERPDYDSDAELVASLLGCIEKHIG